MLHRLPYPYYFSLFGFQALFSVVGDTFLPDIRAVRASLLDRVYPSASETELPVPHGFRTFPQSMVLTTVPTVGYPVFFPLDVTGSPWAGHNRLRVRYPCRNKTEVPGRFCSLSLATSRYSHIFKAVLSGPFCP